MHLAESYCLALLTGLNTVWSETLIWTCLINKMSMLSKNEQTIVLDNNNNEK